MLMRPNIGPQMASEEELASRREVWSMNTGGQGPAGAPKTQHIVRVLDFEKIFKHVEVFKVLMILIGFKW